MNTRITINAILFPVSTSYYEESDSYDLLTQFLPHLPAVQR